VHSYRDEGIAGSWARICSSYGRVWDHVLAQLPNLKVKCHALEELAAAAVELAPYFSMAGELFQIAGVPPPQPRLLTTRPMRLLLKRMWPRSRPLLSNSGRLRMGLVDVRSVWLCVFLFESRVGGLNPIERHTEMAAAFLLRTTWMGFTPH
jgi:hypothetical protein